MADIDRPRYVNRWGFNGSPQPFAAKRVTSSCFVLEGRLSHLEDLCHRFFAEPTGGQIHYRPLTQYVVLTFNQMQSVACADPPYSRTGSGSETEVAFWVLTAAVERMAGTWVAQRLAWFVPYIFVDNSPNLIAGREIYGFPKEIGWFEIPANPGHAQRFSVEASVTKHFGPHARAERAQLLEINRTGGAGKRKSERWTTLEAVGRHVRAALFDAKSWVIPGVHFLEELASDFIHHHSGRNRAAQDRIEEHGLHIELRGAPAVESARSDFLPRSVSNFLRNSVNSQRPICAASVSGDYAWLLHVVGQIVEGSASVPRRVVAPTGDLALHSARPTRRRTR